MSVEERHYCCDCVAKDADDMTEFIIKIVKKQHDENIPANGVEIPELRQTRGSATLKFFIEEFDDPDDDVIGEPLTSFCDLPDVKDQDLIDNSLVRHCKAENMGLDGKLFHGQGL